MTLEFTPEELEERSRVLLLEDEDATEEEHARELGARIAARFGLSYAEMTAPRARGGKPPRARAQLYSALVERGWTFARMGRLVGRDHTSVMFALGLVKQGRRGR